MHTSDLLAFDIRDKFLPAKTGPSGLPYQDIGGMLTFFLPIIMVVAILTFVGMIVWSGIELLNSSGDPKKLSELKNRIIGSVIGIILILSAYILTNLLGSVFNIKLLP